MGYTKTELIMEKWDGFTKEIYNEKCSTSKINNAIWNNKIDNLLEIIQELIDKSPILQEYIYRYIYIHANLGSDESEYKNISSTKYNKILEKAFNDNGFTTEIFDYETEKIPTTDERIKIIKESLGKKTINVDRTIIFELAFGLNMTVDMLELLLTKVLLQSGINAKDYREVIYYWCLKNDFASLEKEMNKCIKAKELLDIYNDTEKLRNLAQNGRQIKVPTKTNNNYTLILLKELKSITDEDDLYSFLYELKQKEINTNISITLMKNYKKGLIDAPRLKEFDLVNFKTHLSEIFPNKTQKEIEFIMDAVKKINYLFTNDSEKSETLESLKQNNVFLTINELEQIQEYLLEDSKEYNTNSHIQPRLRGNTYDTREYIIENFDFQLALIKDKIFQGDYTKKLLPEKYLKKIFSGFIISDKTLRNRLGKTANIKISRKELLYSYFIAYIGDEGIKAEDCEEEVDAFTDYASAFLVENNMYQIYERSPYDLFLLLCMMHENPYNYFMASWAMANL